MSLIQSSQQPGQEGTKWYQRGSELEGRPPLRVLVADDSLLARMVARRQLEGAGLEVLEASSGSAVLQLLSREHVDLLLMDLQMPGLGGLDTTRWIRRMEEMRGDSPLPVLAMTADDSPGLRRECLEAGMNGFLPKTFGVESLLPFLPDWAEIGREALQ